MWADLWFDALVYRLPPKPEYTHTVSCSATFRSPVQTGQFAPCLLFYKQLTAKPKPCLTKRYKLKMSTDAWRTTWHLLGGKTSCRGFFMSGFFFSLKFYTVRAQQRGLGEKKRESCGTVILCCGKGKNVLQVLIDCCSPTCLERKHLWWSRLINSWKNPEAKPSKLTVFERRFLVLLLLLAEST